MFMLNAILNVGLRYSLQGVVIISFILFGMPKVTYASYTDACVKYTDLHVSPGNITINTNDTSTYPTGTLIAKVVDNLEVVFTFTGAKCSGNGSSTWASYYRAFPSVMTYSSPEGSLPVYLMTDYNRPDTFSNGVGFAMSIADPNGIYQPLAFLIPSSPLWTNSGMIYQGALGVKYHVYFVTTAPLIPGVRRFPDGALAFVCLSSSQNRDTKDMCSTILISAFTVTVNSGGCDINPETPTSVNLNRINVNELPKKGDVGRNVDFELSLKCNAATTVNMTLTDPNGGDPANGVVFNDTGDGLAKNVGVQVLSARDGSTTPQTVHLNESFTVGQANEGQYTIPMAARYYRTSDEAIVGGKVSASVVYELSYQ
ncbi:fimbrial protein [Citrobacter amalonaticus]|uniref:fimbrial protein n=1 Tax=Citrobacter amalonaticus TaxID=35703 RepID=UPI00255AAF9E|nr:fimbrial protein [Citrobacter amalonaticus]MDL4618421.1 fimbrial protein [Citrobacter amalonaticus]MDL4622519.1 fimbrial protein [Citrobacter amalonaticus]